MQTDSHQFTVDATSSAVASKHVASTHVERRRESFRKADVRAAAADINDL